MAAAHKEISIGNIQKNMKRREGFVLREVCGEKVLMGEGLGAVDFGKLLSLNETAAWLWQRISDGTDFTTDSLTAALCETYDVTPDEARADVEATVDEWQRLGLLA